MDRYSDDIGGVGAMLTQEKEDERVREQVRRDERGLFYAFITLIGFSVALLALMQIYGGWLAEH